MLFPGSTLYGLWFAGIADITGPAADLNMMASILCGIAKRRILQACCINTAEDILHPLWKSWANKFSSNFFLLLSRLLQTGRFSLDVQDYANCSKSGMLKGSILSCIL
jgi:hypothetical protein